MRLYLDSPSEGAGAGGTVGVLVHHIRERIVEGYREFLDAVGDQPTVGEGGRQEELMGVIKLGEVLSEMINEVDTSGQGLLVSPQ